MIPRRTTNFITASIQGKSWCLRNLPNYTVSYNRRQKNLTLHCQAIVQTVRWRRLTAEVPVRLHTRPCTCGGWSSTDTGFTSKYLSFPSQYNSTNAPHSHFVYHRRYLITATERVTHLFLSLSLSIYIYIYIPSIFTIALGSLYKRSWPT